MILSGSLPAFSTTNDVTASRNLNTPYTNLSGKTMMVIVGCYCENKLSTDNSLFVMKTPAATTRYNVGYTVGVVSGYCVGFLLVSTGATYEIDTSVIGTGAVTKSRWIEVT